MHLDDFDFTLPPEKIAQTPVTPRDHSKLLVINRVNQSLEDHYFFDLDTLLTNNDVLVVNDTKVFPARLLVQKESGKPVELLLEKEVALTHESVTWSALTKPGLKIGERVILPHSHVTAIVVAVDGYTRQLQFSLNREHFYIHLDAWAKTPIPPYIRWNSDDESSLRTLYQTVYAKKVGAMAAPTAGLHFTDELLRKLHDKGVKTYSVTLHVGLGTFLPVKTDNITKHAMHSERFELTQPVASALMEEKRNGKRIIAVGTTTVRVLESCTDTTGALKAQVGATDIFIYPPYQFKFVDSLITNFHTPKSTLLMLVSALCSLPTTNAPFTTFQESLMGKAYKYALDHEYRFYSFGDAMWIR